MTHLLDVARGHGIVARWCAFAEQRLEYLTELFETGRWRRYHSERAFLENIQEAKTAVEVWRDLATREASRDNRAIDASWLDRAAPPLPREDTPRDRVRSVAPQPAEMPVSSPSQDVPVAAQPGRVASDEAPFAPVSDAPVLNDALEPVLDIDSIEQRYPLLRNRL
ncbi:MAG: TIGR03809 family protein [Bradyrhizobium sp.]|uniref:TIGR03809 family protein n=1 Tax=Bradyrhizobium sp. TaxID=376 RepID=UPI00120BD34E|nr:TIGR03809 family protein [Bradyrhizobium sp.]THD62820.1 MAG: TIGR03809 family protein [Bradyrhizobium sp.]